MSTNDSSTPDPRGRDTDDLRGRDPCPSVGGDVPSTPRPEPDPQWTFDDAAVGNWQRVYDDLAGDRRPRREDVLPFLLIRATTPGDRGQRPLWPPIPVWESPDILLIDAAWTGPFDPGRLVGSPTAGRTYRAFVHVWNLGLFPAYGVHVRLGIANAGFNEPATLIGGAMVDLKDRTRPGSHQLVELDTPWTVRSDSAAHDCLMASASCPADKWGGVLDVNGDRHVGQRNLTILSAEQEATPLLARLGEALPVGGTLEMTHAGVDGGRLLQAITGGRLWQTQPVGDPVMLPVDPAPVELLRLGVLADDERHLLTMVRDAGQTVFARSDVLAEVLPDLGAVRDTPTGVIRGLRAEARPAAGPRPVAAAARLRLGNVRAVLDGLSSAQRREVMATTADAPARALPEAVATMLDIGDLRSRTAATALGGRVGQQHVLRFTATDPAGKLIGGYTVVVA